MCGVAGEYVMTGQRPLDPRSLFGIIDALAHRGPDSAGYYMPETDNVVLMHARTPRVDPSGGSQPICNETGSVWVTFNGEIYDHRLQIRNLKAAGHKFQSRCDAEVIPHLFEQHGTDSFARLRGEFAFALYDGNTRKLYLVRDRLGTKPLHYAMTPDSILFASEAKALFRHPAISATLNRDFINRLLLGISMPDGSMFEGIRQVRPGHYLEIGPDGMRECPYWTLRFNEDSSIRSFDAAAEEFRHIMDEAVKLRLDADVQIGSFLSGGLDSALVLESMTRQYDEPIESFTIRFSRNAGDEAQVAARTAAHLGVANTPIDVSTDDLVENLEATVWHAEVPQMNSHGAAKYVLSQRASGSRKAVLTGSGADELFVGYAMYSHQLLLDQKKHGNSEDADGKIKRLLKAENVLPGVVPFRSYRKWGLVNGMFGSYPYQALRAFAFERAVRPLLSRELISGFSATEALQQLGDWLPASKTLNGLEPWRASQYLKITCDLPWYVMTSMDDRPEMAHAMEGRTPFLDKELLDFALRLPRDLLFNEDRGKLLPRHVMAGRLPDEVVNGHTRLFWTPQQRETAVLRSPICRHYLSRAITRDAGFFNPARLKWAQHALAILPQSSKTSSALSSMMMTVATLHMLHDQYVTRFDTTYRRFPAYQRVWSMKDIWRQRAPSSLEGVA